VFVSLILAVVLAQIPDSPVAKPSAPAASAGSFELQGDKLGESVETFVALHPKAECDKSQPARTSCYQWADVAIFGLTAHASAGCNFKKRYAGDCLQGLTARFTDQRLVSLVYTMEGADKSEAVAALKKTLGAPKMESRDGATWNNGTESASVVVGKMMEESSAPSLITISISVAN
jgi:hypothetical protein